MADKGMLYGVGVGPGDPELLTLKAVKIIADCPVVAAPRTRSGGMVALDIVKGAMDLSGKTILPLDFAMSHDADERAASHLVAADLVKAQLDNGHNVAMLNLGDVAIYASYHYIGNLLGGDYQMRMVPGVTSFSAVAAALGVSLTEIGAPLHLIPDGRVDEDAVFALPGTKIWMKSGRNLSVLLGHLRERGLLERAMMVQNCGMPDQRVFSSLEQAEPASEYFTIVILKEFV